MISMRGMTGLGVLCVGLLVGAPSPAQAGELNDRVKDVVVGQEYHFDKLYKGKSTKIVWKITNVVRQSSPADTGTVEFERCEYTDGAAGKVEKCTIQFSATTPVGRSWSIAPRHKWKVPGLVGIKVVDKGKVKWTCAGTERIFRSTLNKDRYFVGDWEARSTLDHFPFLFYERAPADPKAKPVYLYKLVKVVQPGGAKQPAPKKTSHKQGRTDFLNHRVKDVHKGQRYTFEKLYKGKVTKIVWTITNVVRQSAPADTGTVEFERCEFTDGTAGKVEKCTIQFSATTPVGRSWSIAPRHKWKIPGKLGIKIVDKGKVKWTCAGTERIFRRTLNKDRYFVGDWEARSTLDHFPFLFYERVPADPKAKATYVYRLVSVE